MSTSLYVILLLLIVGVALPMIRNDGWFPPIEFFPLGLAALLLAQVIAFRLFGIDVSKSSGADLVEERR